MDYDARDIDDDSCSWDSAPCNSPVLTPQNSDDEFDELDPGAQAEISKISNGNIRTIDVFRDEGLIVARRMWDNFWDYGRMHFRTGRKSAETISDWHGYTLWPYAIGLEALLAAERAAPRLFRHEALEALRGMEKFYSPDHKAYCAWVWFQGNGDIYIDDNAQVAILLALAHKLLPPPKPADGLPYTSYLERASQIVDFCWTGWDSENGGGIRWHVSTEGPPFTNRNACSTSLTAVAALEVATILKAQRDTEARVTELVGWGRKCLDWVWKELVVAGGTMPTNEGLVKDGLVQDTAGGPWRIAGQTYTYNTGHTITGLVLLYDLLPSNDWFRATARSWAKTMVQASINRDKSLFDLTVSNKKWRYWWDNNFFVHLLVEGLVLWGRRFGSEDALLWNSIQAEVKREMGYAITYLRDPQDCLYFRNFRLYHISPQHLSAYKSMTGDMARVPKYDGAERVTDDQSLALPVEKRDMIKTLLGCGGAARGLLIAARI